MNKLYCVIFVLTMAVLGLAEGTRTWEQTKFEEFEKGTSHGIAIRSDGSLELAPAFKPLYTTPSTYIWSIAADQQGNVYAAAGSPARIYRVTPDGQTSIIFAPQELQVQSLVVDDKGVIYAGTSPDGKVYKIEYQPAASSPAKKPAETNAQDKPPVAVDPAYVSSVYFDPKTKYIWDLALDHEGRLYIATGDHGEIYRVEKNGTGGLFFKSDEAHIRAIALDPKGNLIAGSDGSGLVYRISPSGDGFVLYSAPKKEITALAIDPAGNIYAAGVGEKRAAAAPGVLPAPQVYPAAPASAAAQLNVATQPAGIVAIPVQPIPMPGVGAAGGSEVYQIAPDGSPRRIWSSREDVVYALGIDPEGHLLAGTGNRARVFAISPNGDFTDLLKASATQVTAFAPAPMGGLFAATSNLGKVFLLGGSAVTEGSYESDIFDARIFSRWGRAEVRGTGDFDLLARSGNVDNPDRNWSAWKKIDLRKDGEVEAPAARFVQWKVVLRPSNPAARIDSVTLNYLPKNVAPEIDDVVVQVGARFQPMAKTTAPESVSVNLSTFGQPASASAQRFDAAPNATRDRDSIAVRWAAHDDNDDDLVYSLYYRGDGETRWKLLKDDIEDKFYSFDAALLPDGGYTVKVVATDAPSHSPDEALTAEKESPHFEVDTTPPRIDDLNGAVESGELHITFRASDNFSNIKRAEYSVDAGEWHFVEPVGRLSDAKSENYDFAIPVPTEGSTGKTAGAPVDPPDPVVKKPAKQTPAPQEHVIVVRVWDRFDNTGAAKTVIHTK